MTTSNKIEIFPPNPADAQTCFFVTGIFGTVGKNSYENQTPSCVNSGIYSGKFIKSLDPTWSLYSPETNSVLSNGYEVNAQEAFSGFDVSVYLVTGEVNYTGYISGEDKDLLYNTTGKELSLDFQIPYYPQAQQWVISGVERRFSVDVISRDIFSGFHTGSIFLINDSPGVVFDYTGKVYDPEGDYTSSISGSVPYYTETGVVSGELNIGYTLIYGDESLEFSPYTNVYLLSGLSSGESGNFDFTGNQLQEYTVGFTTGNFSGATIPLRPYETGYIGFIAHDTYGSGSLVGLYDLRTGLDPSGDFITGLGDPAPFYFEMVLPSGTGIRASGGDAVFYDIYGNYNPTGSGIVTNYRVEGTGATYSGYSGYPHPLYASSGSLTGKVIGTDPGAAGGYLNHNYLSDSLFSFYQDNSLSFFEGWNPTGGSYWAPGHPKQDNFSVVFEGVSGLDQIVRSGYSYAIFDSDTATAKSYTREEINAFVKPIDVSNNSGIPNEGTGIVGCFSMPINQPNSIDIKFRTGMGFNNVTYEEVSSQLRDFGEMPAVFMYRQQLDKALEVGSGYSGYIGLRRGKTNILVRDDANITCCPTHRWAPNINGMFRGPPWFESGMEFPQLLKDIDYGTITGSGISMTLPTNFSNPNPGSNNIMGLTIFNHYFNTGWSWCNSSGFGMIPTGTGNEVGGFVQDFPVSGVIYRVAGSGYEKIRTFSAYVDAVFEDTIADSLSVTGDIETLSFTNESISFTESQSVFSFSGYPYYYKDGSGLDAQLTWQTCDIYTGTVFGDLPMGEDTLAERREESGQYSIIYNLPDGAENPFKIRYLLYDTVGSGAPSDTFNTNFGKSTQASVVSLDPEYYSESNFKEIEIPFSYEKAPSVSFNIYYTGDYLNCPTVTFLGALLSGFENSKLTFIFSDVVPGTGYALSWQTSALV